MSDNSAGRCRIPDQFLLHVTAGAALYLRQSHTVAESGHDDSAESSQPATSGRIEVSPFVLARTNFPPEAINEFQVS